MCCLGMLGPATPCLACDDEPPPDLTRPCPTCPCLPCFATPCLAMPRHSTPAIPYLAMPCPAIPAWPFQPRTAKPGLRSQTSPRHVRATPILACGASPRPAAPSSTPCLRRLARPHQTSPRLAEPATPCPAVPRQSVPSLPRHTTPRPFLYPPACASFLVAFLIAPKTPANSRRFLYFFSNVRSSVSASSTICRLRSTSDSTDAKVR